MNLKLGHFKFGIEHEVAFIRPDGQFADYTNTSFEEFETMVARLPQYEQDYAQLRIGDAGIKLKRWYVEGFERFDEAETLIDCPPKGIEIRTTICDSIESVINQLSDSFHRLRLEAAKDNFTPALISFNPYQHEFVPNPPLNAYEQQRRRSSPEAETAHIPMLTQGPDLNLSADGLTPAQLIDMGQKLTYYSSFIIPFSYSSPFYKGELFYQEDCGSGLSARTFYRTGARPAVMVFVRDEADFISSVPSLTQIARVPAEVGRIEFKAFDSCGDFRLYASLCALLKGLVLDTTLTERSLVPDATMHQRSARLGFDDEQIYQGAKTALAAASQALKNDSDQKYLHSLGILLERRYSLAQQMIAAYQTGQSIPHILMRGYEALDLMPRLQTC
ncbi:MAG: glutamate--cysteine ligase [Cyanobacteria bacterium P01_D01_bin.105]